VSSPADCTRVFTGSCCGSSPMCAAPPGATLGGTISALRQDITLETDATGICESARSHSSSAISDVLGNIGVLYRI
jgi:hypothetical protein